jgi:UDP-glucuronate 4-epimerase
MNLKENKTILVTGAAGFIGYHLCERLVKEGFIVLALDNINDYYDVNLKYARLQNLGINQEDIVYNTIITSTKHGEKLQFVKLNIEDRENLPELFKTHAIDIVCNLAAQAGVRYSLENPFAYIESNILGFLNILEACRNFNVNKLVYASSSSVYGLNEKIPFSTEDKVDNPISIYAATKKSNELMAHTYSHLFNIETIGLRFFTVYGPWGRPDMAMFLFTDAILNGKPIKVFNEGILSRDFTFIDDIIQGVYLTLTKLQKVDKIHALYNIGNGKPVELLEFIKQIELCTGKKAEKLMLQMQAGDVERTWADTSDLEKDYGYKPVTSINEGVNKFVKWYNEYYK